MNRFLAFAFVVAMTVAAILGVKLQQAKREAEAKIRRAEREVVSSVSPTRVDSKAVQEIRRLEGELQALRTQVADQRSAANETLLVQVELLRQENASLHTLISNQMSRSVATSVPEEPVQPETYGELEDAVEEDPGVGLGVISMNEFRLQYSRMGTLPTAGAVVVELIPGGTAMSSGLQLGDIITSMDGEPVDSAVVFESRLSTMVPGRVTTLEINRDRAEVIIPLLIPLQREEE